jgi:hypothetical protein
VTATSAPPAPAFVAPNFSDGTLVVKSLSDAILIVWFSVSAT